MASSLLVESAPPSPLMQAFGEFQTELDGRHNKYERLVKLSRDVTIDSKRAIFQLQRIPGSNRDACERILTDVRGKLDEIVGNKFYVIAEELENEDAYQYIRAYSPGLQEFIEAESLYHYLRSAVLISRADISRSLTFARQRKHSAYDETPSPLSVTVSPLDYVLGIADLTGEVMRLAVTYVSKGDLDRPFELRDFLHEICDTFTAFEFCSRDLSRKIFVLQQSLMKVENVCYNLRIRGSEVPRQTLVDMFSRPADSVAELVDDM